MFNHKKIEKKWAKYWDENKTFKTTDKSDKKYYVLDMFPYPSGSGLHVGHPEGYTATDIVARYKRLNGFDVLHPIGWDAFGLPAEQYAIKTGNHPNKFTIKNINNFRRQLKELGFSFDYDKEVNTTDPKFFKTTQWIFIQMYKKGLAKIKEVNVNWCQELGTVLANEEVLKDENGNGVSERGGFKVIQKPMKQWVLKITDYAQKLYDGINDLDWPSSLKSLQKNWIFSPEDGSLHLRDWVFSRQRYWGEPFPFAFNEKDEIMIMENLPLELPEMDEIKPSGTGESPLANNKEWLYFDLKGTTWRKDTNTMPQWAGSSWYYLAYILKNDDGSYFDITSKEAKERFEKWLPVDLYIGGQEHAVLHLLYARFWHKVLFDLGIVNTEEPFQKIINQGMILGPDMKKMSKSKGNVINPDDIIIEFGGDTLRLYEMFMGPLEETKPWSEQGVKGIRKWLQRVYDSKQFISEEKNISIISSINNLIKNATKDIEKLKFNTVISKMMVFINDVYKNKNIDKDSLEKFLVILSLFAPFIAEEMLSELNKNDVFKQEWPAYNEDLIKKENIIIPVQINGKTRGKLILEDWMKEDDIISHAKKIPNVKNFIDGKKIIKEIYILKKIINLVVK
ncbi:MAG: class I tRNA ligase family protein [Mollicutes bacterium PWAP]|nr:class I tRNA ligase family protein [Mollicutes bacterium PWAP]